MKHLRKYLYFLLSFSFVFLFIGSPAFALSTASNNFVAGQTYAFAGHYRLITVHTSSFSLTLNSGDTIVGAYAGYGSEVVGTQLPPSGGMRLTANGFNYSGAVINQELFTGNGNYFNSSGVLANGSPGIYNGIMQSNNFSASGLGNLGAGTYSMSLQADSAKVSGSGLGAYYAYFVVENDALPLQEVVVNTFAMDDYGSNGGTQTITIPTKAGVAPAIGQSVKLNTQVSTPDAGDTMDIDLGGVNAYNGLSTAPSPSVVVNATMQQDFANGKLQAQVTYHNSDTNAPEVIQGFGITLPMTTVAMNYHLTDTLGALIPFNGTFGGSFTSTESGSSPQSETIKQGQLILTGILGDTFPSLQAPTVPNYTFISGPTLNVGGSYMPIAPNPNSAATCHYYKNAQHTTKIIDQNGNDLATSVTTNGTDGATYQSTAPTFTGYSLQTTTGATSGTYNHTVGDTTTTFQFTNIGTVTLHFLDAQTKQPLQPDQVITGLQLQPFSITPQGLTGYRQTNPMNLYKIITIH